MLQKDIKTTHLQTLSQQLKGDLFWDETLKLLYATDASAYRELPLAIAIPKTEEDIQTLIEFAQEQKTSLIPRTAGTSLAGQVVGNGIVVDVSKYFTQILEVNPDEKWVRVQPGVVRNELNHFLNPYGLFFGPETSTANRAMIGGMVGNNSCGTHSVVYFSTREHTLEIKGFLSDGSKVCFSTIADKDFTIKANPLLKSPLKTLENNIYEKVAHILLDEENQQEIREKFPKTSIPRRNTGYALDLLLNTSPFTEGTESFNMSKLICGSEGTLMFITEIKLNLVPLPPKEIGLICIHSESIDAALRANIIALKYKPSACELMDNYILECTKANVEQRQNRFFVEGEPAAILVVEFTRETKEEIQKIAEDLEQELRVENLGYHFPVVWGEDSKRVWTLRAAGLGLLSNLVGDAKPAPVIEDTAVDVEDLPAYIADFNKILEKYGLNAVHYAHAGSGELHLRPILNLKTEKGHQLFRSIAEEIAQLVKKYKGSLSGEHGDGRLRGEFIPTMVGEKNYDLMCQIKQVFDPDNIFNPGKIVHTPPMDTNLRYQAGQKTPEFDTVFDFSQNQGILRAAELCNGSGDCRKTEISGGTMCPSYMATRNEKDTTRARANILREVLTHSTQKNAFDSGQIKEVMDLCLSCKGCKSECPSNVDVGKMKAEFLEQYYQSNKVPRRTKLIAASTKYNQLASKTPKIYNMLIQNTFTSKLIKNYLGFAQERPLPTLGNQTLRKWFRQSREVRRQKTEINNTKSNFRLLTSDFSKRVYLFVDEFTNYLDVEIGKKAVLLLQNLGYQVEVIEHEESGRTYLSKGLVRKAKEIAQKNIDIFKDLISEETPLIGIEPSAILTFRDEYIDLLRGEEKVQAQKIADNTFTFDEFFAQEIDKGNIQSEQFTEDQRILKLHGHCHQKALSSLVPSKKMLSLPKNYEMHLIPSGCCGMAGSFGYEKEHYQVSMQIGELVLFPTVRKSEKGTIIVASGTSCRHQIKDGTGRIAQHPIETMWNALKK